MGTNEMGKGKNEYACGSRPIWIGVSSCLAVCGLITLIVGIALLVQCSSAQSDCKDDAACNLIYADGCYDGTIDTDCDDLSGSVKTVCNWYKACECGRTRGAMASLALGIIFLTLTAIFCCGICPCACFKGSGGDSTTKV